ncbi:MAG TPA: SRPBCC family protein [Ilumatobacter sp.]|nr:SRPBCC family protein [Ilumatobacter sp.]
MAQLPIHQPEWIGTAPVVVRRERSVLAPPAAVWKHIADHHAWPQWFKGLTTVQVTGASEGVGGQRVASMTGTTVGEVFTAWTPNEQFAFAIVTGPRVLAGMAESVVLEPDEGGCTVVYTIGIEPASGFGWLVKLGSKRLAKMLEKALDALALRAQADHAAGVGIEPGVDAVGADADETAGDDGDDPDGVAEAEPVEAADADASDDAADAADGGEAAEPDSDGSDSKD